MAHETFGAGLDPTRVRLLFVPGWTRAFVAGPRLIVWPARARRPDFAAPEVPLSVRATFVHELTHVWQAQNGVSLLLAKIKAGDGPAAYAYGDIAAEAFLAMNIEQQAMVVEHAFLAAHGGVTPHPAERYAEASVHWRRG